MRYIQQKPPSSCGKVLHFANVWLNVPHHRVWECGVLMTQKQNLSVYPFVKTTSEHPENERDGKEHWLCHRLPAALPPPEACAGSNIHTCRLGEALAPGVGEDCRGLSSAPTGSQKYLSWFTY